MQQGFFGLSDLLRQGGVTLALLLIGSIVSWVVIFERFWLYRKLDRGLHSFHLQAMNALLKQDPSRLRALCTREAWIPTARALTVVLDRVGSSDKRIQARWRETMERERQKIGQELKRRLWVLGTFAAAAPFLGLFGTVLGILQAFHEMAKSGTGGFTVVASGISEALVATAAGILVAVISVLAFNVFQVKLGRMLFEIRMQFEELAELLEDQHAR